jgi:radical SAM superfamily enzyme YgiQ (UPF0313 family)
MKIALLTPPVLMEELHPRFSVQKNRFWELLIGEKGILSGFKPVSGRQPPFGLLFLSSQLKKHGHEVFFLDGYFHTYDSIIDNLRKNIPDIVGMGCMSYNWEKTKVLASMLRETIPELKIVVGGKHPTVWENRCLEECDAIDFVVMGEAEESIIELVESIEKNDGYHHIKGIIFKASDGEIFNTGYRDPVEDLDSLPFFDREIIDVDTYRPTPFFYRQLPHTAVFASRGCPYTCTFCHSERRVRFRSAENVVEEIGFALNHYGIREFSFYDETFTLKPEYADTLCELILQKGIRITWTANARADRLDLGLLKKMRRAGCWRLLFGIESGVQKNLKMLKKHQDLEQVKEGVEITRESGMESYGMFMFGIPGETYEDGLQTINYACGLALDYAHFVNITPFPGTELYEQVKDEPGVKDLSSFTNTDIGYVPSSMTEEQLVHLLNISFKKFYYRPGFIFSRFGKIRSYQDFKRYSQGFLALAATRDL